MKLKFQLVYMDETVLEFRHEYGPWTVYVGDEPEYIGIISASAKSVKNKTNLSKELDKKIQNNWKLYTLKKL